MNGNELTNEGRQARMLIGMSGRFLILTFGMSCPTPLSVFPDEKYDAFSRLKILPD